MVQQVDKEKAYDRVSWKFLEQVLRKVGFQQQLIDLIMFCVTSAKLSVMWNGERLEFFTPQRGLRQGDPLSPYFLCYVWKFWVKEYLESRRRAAGSVESV